VVALVSSVAADCALCCGAASKKATVGLLAFSPALATKQALRDPIRRVRHITIYASDISPASRKLSLMYRELICYEQT
jgi:hypothetical protein